MSNAIQYNSKNGAVSISILFMKEKRNMAIVESKDSSSSLPTDNFISHEIGKLVTVVKDTGPGIQEFDQLNLFNRNSSKKKLNGDNLKTDTHQNG